MKFIKKHIHFILFVFISFHFAVNANSPIIPTINLIDNKKQYFEKLPIYYQGTLNTCYSFSASTMIDYYRLSHGDTIQSKKDLSSALWLASNYKSHSPITSAVFKLFNENDHPLYDVGTAAFAINQANKTGHCTYSTADHSMKNILNNIEKLTNEHFDSMSFIQFLSKLLADIDSEIQMATTNKDYEIPKKIYSLPEYMTDRTYAQYIIQKAPIISNPKPALKSAQCEPESEKLRNQIGSFDSIKDIISNTHNGGEERIEINALNNKIKNVLTDLQLSRRERKKIDLNTLIYTPYIAEPDATRVAATSVEIDKQKHIKEIAFENVIERYINNAEYIKNPAKKKSFQNFILFIWNYHYNLKKLEDDIFSLLKNCNNKKHKIEIPDAKWSILTGKSNDNSMLKIQASLTKNNPQPVELVFCGGLLYSDDEFTIPITKCSYHSALIVGQRTQSGKPQLLIQNSSGKSCRLYSKKWECIEGQGAIWVDAEEILNKSIFMSWL